MSMLFFQFASVLFGLVIGSFLTVCVFRLPLGRPKGPPVLRGAESEGEDDVVDEEYLEEQEDFESISIVSPARSFCPHCDTQLKWYNNIPFFSWLFQMGRCAYCKARIPFMYPMVELLSAASAYLVMEKFVLSPPFSALTALLVYVFCCVLIVITFIDIEYYIIPNKITYPGTVLGFLLVTLNQFTGILASPVCQSMAEAFWGFMAGAGMLWGIGKTYEVLRGHQGLGLGDVKLLAVIGVLFGPQCALFTIFMGSIVGAVLGVLSLLLLRGTLSRPLPFGPYLAIACAMYLFLGPESFGSPFLIFAV